MVHRFDDNESVSKKNQKKQFSNVELPLMSLLKRTNYWSFFTLSTGVGSGGYAGHLSPQLCGGDIDMYIPLEKPNT